MPVSANILAGAKESGVAVWRMASISRISLVALTPTYQGSLGGLSLIIHQSLPHVPSSIGMDRSTSTTLEILGEMSVAEI